MQGGSFSFKESHTFERFYEASNHEKLELMRNLSSWADNAGVARFEWDFLVLRS
jgi:hypothetical protein